ncbi:DUF349 domain-containing protein [Fluviicola chungangensis]|uniref:DUF349 domain-containing protein n=1 Tax=Fluviicola chungangensis TaxID=2597671 RepID=A0A556MYF3_9FLAO|nr:DUF349 domain-containing protein [Fluviicola chungangensis]TSJ44863.1 DUF349 domain-containing protein [Fluviicola chungangensis]
MEKASLLESLKNLVQQEDALAVAREVSELRNQFEDVVLEEDRQFQIKQLDAQEKGEPVEERTADPVREEFYGLYNEFRERKGGLQKAKKEAEESNLRRKKALLDRLKEVVEKEENIGAAMTAYKEIHDAWKEVGDIPREKRQDIQSEYSRLLETFFYHIKIYRELREHDLHRNHQLKLDVIRRIQELSQMEHVKDVEQAIKTLQNEWDETGPVGNDAWESLKNSYWDAVRAVYARIQAFYDEKRTELAANLELKKDIARKAAELVKDFASTNTKEWETATASLLALQEEWKKIGFGPRKENEEVWKEFRASCDEFFAKKKAFFDSIRGKFDEVAAKKQQLVEKLEELKHSTEWKKTTDQILAIQKDWKELGSAGQRFEQKLWKEFRAACDHFFEAKQAHFSSKDKEFEGNLALKMELIERIKTAAIPEDKKEAMALLKNFATEFNSIGHVPMKEKDRVFNAYKEALDAHYKKLKLEGAEQEKMLFQARLDTMKADPNADRALAREKYDLHDKINKLKSDILQFENNLGFFAKSKGADILKKEVEGKIAAAQRKIEELKAKIKMMQ